MNQQEETMNNTQIRPEVRLKPSRYQPSKAKLDEDVRIEATPEDLIRAAFQPVKVIEDPDA